MPVIYITQAELDAIHHSIDFIASNSDGADDLVTYADLQNKLRNVWNKGMKVSKPRRKP